MQRAFEGSSTFDGPGGDLNVQRVFGDTADGGPAGAPQAPGVDMEALADEVYSRLRWRLSAERERTFGVR
jgi:hypothetical protein